jgi:hypothetical protein
MSPTVVSTIANHRAAQKQPGSTCKLEHGEAKVRRAPYYCRVSVGIRGLLKGLDLKGLMPGARLKAGFGLAV